MLVEAPIPVIRQELHWGAQPWIRIDYDGAGRPVSLVRRDAWDEVSAIVHVGYPDPVERSTRTMVETYPLADGELRSEFVAGWLIRLRRTIAGEIVEAREYERDEHGEALRIRSLDGQGAEQWSAERGDLSPNGESVWTIRAAGEPGVLSVRERRIPHGVWTVYEFEGSGRAGWSYVEVRDSYGRCRVVEHVDLESGRRRTTERENVEGQLRCVSRRDHDVSGEIAGEAATSYSPSAWPAHDFSWSRELRQLRFCRFEYTESQRGDWTTCRRVDTDCFGKVTSAHVIRRVLTYRSE